MTLPSADVPQGRLTHMQQNKDRFACLNQKASNSLFHFSASLCSCTMLPLTDPDPSIVVRPSIHSSFCSCIPPFVSSSFCWSIRPVVCPSVCPSVCLTVCSSAPPSVGLSILLSVYPSGRLFNCSSAHLILLLSSQPVLLSPHKLDVTVRFLFTKFHQTLPLFS